MSTTQVQSVVKLDHHRSGKRGLEKQKRGTLNQNFSKKYKHDKFFRKRAHSFPSNAKFRMRPTLPTKFLLGGNICDPLNLNSLQDEAINREMNAVTPKSSPLPTPPGRKGQIEVIIPANIHDPLNLNCADDAEYEQQMASPQKKIGKKRKKKKRNSSSTTEPSDLDVSGEIKNDSLSDSSKSVNLNAGTEPEEAKKDDKVVRELSFECSPVKDRSKRKSEDHKEGAKKMRRLDSMDKIVSPVIPQPGSWYKRPIRSGGNAGRGAKSGAYKQQESKRADEKEPTFKEKNKMFQYGNYNRYYGYRNAYNEGDIRLKYFASHRHLFANKDILDVGCNIGHVTLTVARDFGAKSIVGIDIDKKLIEIARKNVRHYVNCSDSPRNEDDKNDKFFPISMPILYGPVDIPGTEKTAQHKGFPHNVRFVQGNYILDDDSLLLAEQPQFDVILCLSVTKWIHLNWGDAGLKQSFRRMYAQLRPGGKLILEPQSWASYKRKKKLTETIYKNYSSIEFYPEKFTQYLLSSEVGFAKSEILAIPLHISRGFQRPIQIFTKSDISPSWSSHRSESITPSHTATSVSRTRVYTNLTSPGNYLYEADTISKDLPDGCADSKAPFENETERCPSLEKDSAAGSDDA